MDKQLKVSIIVPVYKVEEYIERCIESIINQSYPNLEIILVDDESPDSCGEICEIYAKKDNRIKVIHKENGGLSDARNVGIQIATGEYIIFVDSDDYIETNSIEKMVYYAELEDLDVICADAHRITESELGTTVDKLVGGFQYGKVLTGEDYLVKCIERKTFSVAVWMRMYKTSLIKENNIYFVKGLLHEDENWTPQILLKAKRVGYYDILLYNYKIRENSITQSSNKTKHIGDIMRTCMELERLFNASQISLRKKKVLNDYLAKLYINTCTISKDFKEYSKIKVNKNFGLRNAYFLQTKIEALIFAISIPLYRFIKKTF